MSAPDHDDYINDATSGWRMDETDRENGSDVGRHVDTAERTRRGGCKPSTAEADANHLGIQAGVSGYSGRGAWEQKPPCVHTEPSDESLNARMERPKAAWKCESRARDAGARHSVISVVSSVKPGLQFSVPVEVNLLRQR